MLSGVNYVQRSAIEAFGDETLANAVEMYLQDAEQLIERQGDALPKKKPLRCAHCCNNTGSSL